MKSCEEIINPKVATESEQKKQKFRNDSTIETTKTANTIINESQIINKNHDNIPQQAQISIEDEQAINDLEEIKRPRTSKNRLRRRYHRSKKSTSLIADCDAWVGDQSYASSMDENSMDEGSILSCVNDVTVSGSMTSDHLPLSITSCSNQEYHDNISNLSREKELERRRLRRERKVAKEEKKKRKEEKRKAQN